MHLTCWLTASEQLQPSAVTVADVDCERDDTSQMRTGAASQGVRTTSWSNGMMSRGARSPTSSRCSRRRKSWHGSRNGRRRHSRQTPGASRLRRHAHVEKANEPTERIDAGNRSTTLILPVVVARLWTQLAGVIKLRVGRFLADLNAPTIADAERLARRLADLQSGG
jgi:hypothetical protein